MLLKSKTSSIEMTGKRLSKLRLSTTFQLRFVNTEKLLVKLCVIENKDFPIAFLLKQSISILIWKKQTKIAAV